MNGLPQRLTGCSVLPPRDEVEQVNAPSYGHQRARPKGAAKNRKAAADRFAMLNAFIDFTLADLSRNEVAVWLILYRDSRAGIAQTSQTNIARRAGVSDRTVRRTAAKLTRLGLLKVMRRGGINRGPSSYQVLPLLNVPAADKVLTADNRTE